MNQTNLLSLQKYMCVCVCVWPDLQKVPVLSKHLWPDLWKNHCQNITKTVMCTYSCYVCITILYVCKIVFDMFNSSFFANQVIYYIYTHICIYILCMCVRVIIYVCVWPDLRKGTIFIKPLKTFACTKVIF